MREFFLTRSHNLQHDLRNIFCVKKFINFYLFFQFLLFICTLYNFFLQSPRFCDSASSLFYNCIGICLVFYMMYDTQFVMIEKNELMKKSLMANFLCSVLLKTNLLERKERQKKVICILEKTISLIFWYH